MPKGKMLSALWKAVRGFFAFWKDFLVGDSPVLALGAVIIVFVAYLLRGSPVLAPVTAIILVLVLMTFTVWQKTRKRRSEHA
jgi:hypothetical protein